MKLINFPLSNLTNNSNKVKSSLPYQEWEIEQIIENLSEGEQDLLIESIAALVQEWELTLDAELELSLQTKYKDSKTSLGYTDWLYDLAQEEVYRAYAIEQLDKQKNKISIAQKANHQSLVGSNNCTNIRPTNSFTPNTQTVAATATTATTPTDSVTTAITNSIDNLVDRNALTNKPNIDSNSPLNEEELINQIIENLSEVQQDALMEKIVILMEQWELTTDAGLKLALKLQHQKHQPNIPYQDFLYELAQSQVYREYATQQLELIKQNSFAFIEPFNQIEKVHHDKLTNVDDVNIAGFNFNDKEATRDEVISIGETNHLINYLNQESVVSQDSDSLENCLQHTNSSQGHQNEINKPLIVSNNNYHTTKVLPNYSSKFPIKYINQQNSNFALANYSWKNSLPLTKVKKALLMHVHQGKPASIYHPPSLPP